MTEYRPKIRDSGYDFSQHPEKTHLRTALYLFSYAVTAADVASCFPRVLDMKIDPDSQHHSDVGALITDRVVRTPPPTTLNPYALTYQLLQIMQPALWLKLLQRTQKSDSAKEIYENLKEAFPPGFRQGSVLETAAYQFASHNLPIMGHTLLDLGLAAVYGPDYPRAIPERAKFASDETTPAPRYEAVLDASKPFAARASSAAEVVGRLQQLFPPNPRSEPTSAFSALQRNHTFDGPVDKCPAGGLTLALFDAYGRKLREEPYQRRLVTALNLPRENILFNISKKML